MAGPCQQAVCFHHLLSSKLGSMYYSVIQTMFFICLMDHETARSTSETQISHVDMHVNISTLEYVHTPA